MQANFNAFCKNLLVIYGLCYWYILFLPEISHIVLGDVIKVEESLFLFLWICKNYYHHHKSMQMKEGRQVKVNADLCPSSAKYFSMHLTADMALIHF